MFSDPRERPGDDDAPRPGRRWPSFRRFTLSWGQAAVIAACVLAVIALGRDAGPQDRRPPDWTRATGHPSMINALAFAPDGRRVATGGDDGVVVVWRVGGGAETELLNEPTQTVFRLAFSANGSTLAAVYLDATTVVLWDVGNGRKRATLRGHALLVRCLAFSADGSTLVTGSGDESIRLWDVPTGELKAVLRGHGRPITAVGVSRDGRTLASASDDGLVKLRDLSDGAAPERIGHRAHRGLVHCLAFSPDGTILASGAVGDGIKLWEVVSGLERATVLTDRGYIHAATFTRDGQTLIVAKYAGVIQLWDVAAGRERASVRIAADDHLVTFSADGRSLATAGGEATVNVWDLAGAFASNLGR